MREDESDLIRRDRALAAAESVTAAEEQLCADREQALADADQALTLDLLLRRPVPDSARDALKWRSRQRAWPAGRRYELAAQRTTTATSRDEVAVCRDANAGRADEVRERMQRDALSPAHPLIDEADSERTLYARARAVAAGGELTRFGATLARSAAGWSRESRLASEEASTTWSSGVRRRICRLLLR